MKGRFLLDVAVAQSVFTLFVREDQALKTDQNVTNRNFFEGPSLVLFSQDFPQNFDLKMAHQKKVEKIEYFSFAILRRIEKCPKLQNWAFFL